jgi:hypothetical protein
MAVPPEIGFFEYGMPPKELPESGYYRLPTPLRSRLRSQYGG